MHRFFSIAGILLIWQIPFFIFSHYLGIYRPLLYVEYMIPIILLMKLWKKATIIVFTAIWILETILVLLQVLNHYNLTHWRNALPFISQISYFYWLIIFTYTVILCVFTSMSIFYLKPKLADLKNVLIGFIIVFLINIPPFINGFLPYSNYTKEEYKYRLLGSQLLSLDDIITKRQATHAARPYHRYYDIFTAFQRPYIGKWLKDYILKNRPKMVLFVIVESWGIPTNKIELSQQLLPLSHDQSFYNLKQDATYASPTTINAEVRELCGFSETYVDLKDLPIEVARSHCLPNLLKQQNYNTVAYHAGKTQMYNRAQWYSTLGLDKIYFFETLQHEKLRRCHNWPGVCDVDLASHITKNAHINQKEFIYWLSLNSHHPFKKEDILYKQQSECQSVNIPMETQRCNHYLITAELIEAIHQSILESHLNEALIVLVGDHPPPFARSQDRDAFEAELVPAVAYYYKRHL